MVKKIIIEKGESVNGYKIIGSGEIKCISQDPKFSIVNRVHDIENFGSSEISIDLVSSNNTHFIAKYFPSEKRTVGIIISDEELIKLKPHLDIAVEIIKQKQKRNKKP